MLSHLILLRTQRGTQGGVVTPSLLQKEPWEDRLLQEAGPGQGADQACRFLPHPVAFYLMSPKPEPPGLTCRAPHPQPGNTGEKAGDSRGGQSWRGRCRGPEGRESEPASAGQEREDREFNGSHALYSTCEGFPHRVPYQCNSRDQI